VQNVVSWRFRMVDVGISSSGIGRTRFVVLAAAQHSYAAGEALETAVALASSRGAACTSIDLLREDLPPPIGAWRDRVMKDRGDRFLRLLRGSDALVVVMESVVGEVSQEVRKALAYAELLKDPAGVLFAGRAVGLIVAAPTRSTAFDAIVTLRSVVHALQGWPAPAAVVATPLNGPTGDLDTSRRSGADIVQPVELLIDQLFSYAERWARCRP
jgi:FMN reductase